MLAAQMSSGDAQLLLESGSSSNMKSSVPTFITHVQSVSLQTDWTSVCKLTPRPIFFLGKNKNETFLHPQVWPVLIIESQTFNLMRRSPSCFFYYSRGGNIDLDECRVTGKFIMLLLLFCAVITEICNMGYKHRQKLNALKNKTKHCAFYTNVFLQNTSLRHQWPSVSRRTGFLLSTLITGPLCEKDITLSP